MTKIKKKGNLTQKKGCYAYWLVKYQPEIMTFISDAEVSLRCLKAFVLEVIKPANIVDTAKPRFEQNIKDAPTKEWVGRLVLAAIEHAKKITCDLD